MECHYGFHRGRFTVDVFVMLTVSVNWTHYITQGEALVVCVLLCSEDVYLQDDWDRVWNASFNQASLMVLRGFQVIKISDAL